MSGGYSRKPLPGDTCDDHQTQHESDSEDAAIVIFWSRIGLDASRFFN